MTVASEVSRSGPYIGNGVTTVFNYGFRILDESHLRVIRAEAGAETVLAIDTDYIVSDVGEPGGGQIALLVAPTASQTITILRSVPFTQETDLENQGAYFAETIEAAFDQAAMRDQQLNERLDRALVVPASADSGALDNLIANVVLLAGNVDDINTVASIAGDVSDVAAVAADVSIVAANDLNVSAVAGNAANINAVAGIAGAVLAVAAIDDDVVTVADHAAELPVIAGNMAAVTTVAGIAAAVSGVAAIDDDVTAVAGNLADVSNFSDVYRGGNAVDPLTRRDGSALLAGDMTFNTIARRLRWFNGTVWGEVGRERLTADRTYYVRTDGNDANDGLSNTAAGAFKTLQRAWDFVASTLDFAGYIVSIKVADGTYTAGVNMAGGRLAPNGQVKFVGNVASPSNVLLNTSNVSIFVYNGPGINVQIMGFKLQCLSSLGVFNGVGIHAGGQGLLYYTAMDFGTCLGGHVISDCAGYVVTDGAYTISGGGPHHIQARCDGLVSMHGPAVTITGVPAFSRAFAVVESIGRLSTSAAFVGAATGRRYEFSNGICQIGGVVRSAMDTYFPGDASGVVYPGGKYIIGISDPVNIDTRERLMANRTYYVRTDGNDANDGLSNTAAGAFLTIQRAINVAFGLLDLNGFDVDIQLVAGTYTGNVVVPQTQVGLGKITIVGDVNTANAGSYIVTSAAGNTIAAQAGAVLYVKGFELRSAAGDGIEASSNGTVNISGYMRFGACAGSHMRPIGGGSSINLNSAVYAIVGSATYHFNANPRGLISAVSASILIPSGTTLNFSGAFALVSRQGLIQVNGATVTNSGTVTGTRHLVSGQGQVFGASSVNLFPGSVAGTVDAASFALWI